MCSEWMNIWVIYIVDPLVNIMFNKACVECIIEFIYDPRISHT